MTPLRSHLAPSYPFLAINELISPGAPLWDVLRCWARADNSSRSTGQGHPTILLKGPSLRGSDLQYVHVPPNPTPSLHLLPDFLPPCPRTSLTPANSVTCTGTSSSSSSPASCGVERITSATVSRRKSHWMFRRGINKRPDRQEHDWGIGP